MTELYVEVETSGYCTRPPAVGRDNGDYQESYNGISVQLSWSDRYFGPSKKIETDGDYSPGDICFPVIVRYQTGSTFGTRRGCVEVVDILKDATKAFQFKAAIEEAYEDREYRFEFNDKEYYSGTWTGYFERLENIIIETVMIKA